MSGWGAHLVCEGCWQALMAAEGTPERLPVRLKALIGDRELPAELEPCAVCGRPTHSGIYRRFDPPSLAEARRTLARRALSALFSSPITAVRSSGSASSAFMPVRTASARTPGSP